MTTWGRFLFHSEDFVRDLSACLIFQVEGWEEAIEFRVCLLSTVLSFRLLGRLRIVIGSKLFSSRLLSHFCSRICDALSRSFGCGTQRASIKSIAALERSHQSSSGNDKDACATFKYVSCTVSPANDEFDGDRLSPCLKMFPMECIFVPLSNRHAEVI